MTAKDSEYLEQFTESLADWTDERFITRDQIGALAKFNLYLVNLAEEDGWSYSGHSLKMGTPMCCLVVKAYIEDAPVVVFTSARSPTGCVVTFMRKLDQGLLEWRDDQYRQ